MRELAETVLILNILFYIYLSQRFGLNTEVKLGAPSYSLEVMKRA